MFVQDSRELLLQCSPIIVISVEIGLGVGPAALVKLQFLEMEGPHKSVVSSEKEAGFYFSEAELEL